MLGIYNFEQLEIALYYQKGFKVKMEPFLVSLFNSQVSDPSCLASLLIVKWWARLNLVEVETLSKDRLNNPMYYCDFFGNSC